MPELSILKAGPAHSLPPLNYFKRLSEGNVTLTGKGSWSVLGYFDGNGG